MRSVDVVVAGGGISGLLVASALAAECSVLLLEQCETVPRNKYWLTDEKAANENPQFSACIDRRYDFLDFVAYDRLTATIRGSYCLWDTDKLVEHLLLELSQKKVEVLTGHRLYSLAQQRDGVSVHVNSEIIRARLIVDCMGFGSPIVGAKNVAQIVGYYILHGCEIGIRENARPVAFDNVIIDRSPAYFELFPTSNGTAHTAIILPSRQYKPGRSLKGELHFILRKSHYSKQVIWDESLRRKSYFGIVPVGRLYEPALDRIVFFGEAGQTNPAASATGLSRMLNTYRDLARSLMQCLRRDSLRRKDLLQAIPRYMTHMNRLFQESLFESILSFDSDDFRCLVQEMNEYPAHVVNGLLFADYDFKVRNSLRLALDALLRPRGLLGRHVAKSISRLLS